MRNNPLAVAVLGLAVLAGCAGKKAEGPAQPVIAGRIDLSPDDPRAKALMQMICRSTACRQGTSIHLRIPNAPDFANGTDLHTPYANSKFGMLFLNAGETLSFEADEGANGPVEPHYVDKVTHPERTITLSLEQRPEIADGYGMRLTVRNPFGKALKFTASAAQPNQQPDAVAGICPAPPRGETRKIMPYPVVSIVIASLSFVPTEEAEACAP